jgi:hypothetical protein
VSAKYERIKKADLDLPTPLRWLTRAFSSITLAVILLLMVAMFGLLASVPVFFLLLGLIYGLTLLGTVGVAAVAAIWLWRWAGRVPLLIRAAATILLLGLASLAASVACAGAYHWISAQSFFMEHRATVIYRLPWIEMTELEFYGWWPMKLILILFVLNMVWATIRRIEFKFVNIGVLTVHTGIVVLALGAILYGHFKLEGDTILWRQDLGGRYESVFYDATTAAIYVTAADGRQVMMPLYGLPRYNDYELGSLDIRLHDRPGFSDLLGAPVRMTIPGFLAYADLRPVWVEATGPVSDEEDAGPAVRLEMGDAEGTSAKVTTMLLAKIPAQRVIEGPGFAVEYLAQPTPQRIANLAAQFEGEHGLVVEIPEQSFRQVYSIHRGDVIELGQTGYTLTIGDIGPYGMPFVTEGYRGASDSRAMIQVQGPNGRQFTRMAMFRYPERSQDFVPAPDDPNVGPMGRRTDPDPAISLTYLDGSKPQFHLFAQSPDQEQLDLIVRLPGIAPMQARLTERRFPIGSQAGQSMWVHIRSQIAHAMHSFEPAPTPKLMRASKEEGTFVRSLLPVLIETEHEGRPWSKLVWLTHMRYPHYPEGMNRPVPVDVPGVGTIELAFSREQHTLPFAIALKAFEMVPYPGSDIPRDFVADLLIGDIDERGTMKRQPTVAKAKLNNPIIYRPADAPLGLGKIKISQTGWDPGDNNDPMRQARDDQGRLINQQRFTILGFGNNVAIRVIFVGSCLVLGGIPWAFYVKPYLVKRQKRKIQQTLAKPQTAPQPPALIAAR